MAGRTGSDPRSSRLARSTDRKSTRLNSSHDQISYAVFCLEKKRITMASRSRKLDILVVGAGDDAVIIKDHIVKDVGEREQPERVVQIRKPGRSLEAKATL